MDPSDYDPEDWGLVDKFGRRADEKPEVIVADGRLVSNPSPGENRAGKRNCLFTLNTGDGSDINLYTVRYRDECMRLVAGDKVRVRYVRNDGHNNLVASPEMLEEGGKTDRIMTAVENLDRAQHQIVKQQSHISMLLSELRKEVGRLAEKVGSLERDLFEGPDDGQDAYDDDDMHG